MASDLYETLELPKNAAPEQIRKAYKKKALQTHPDRLPPNSTPEDKAISEDLFRKVNNAYEVLSDPQNRRVYDLHGVWPPPEPESIPLPRRNGDSRHRTHSQYRYHNPRHNAPPDLFFEDHDLNSFVFTDPFSLFDSIFGFDNRHRHSHQYHHNQHRSNPPRTVDPFGMPFDDLFDRGLGGGFGLPLSIHFPSFEPPSFSDGGHGAWAQESFMTTTINGVTQSVRKRRDWEGNEHVTRTYPDGREVRSINGVEQPPSPRGYIAPNSSRTETRHSSSPAAASQPRLSTRPTPTQHPPYPPPPYPGHAPAGYGSSPTMASDYGRHRDRRYSDTRPVIPDPYTSERPDTGRHNSQHRKRWWRGGHS